MMKYCKGCSNEKTIDNFYRQGKHTVNSYATLCKKCHNDSRKCGKGYKIARKKRNPVGFAKLPISKRIEVLTLLEKNLKLKEIERITNVKYTSLWRWRRNGTLC